MFGRVFWGVRVVGRENIPASGPYIAASSHESFLDPFLVGSVFHRINFLARRTLFETRGRPSRFKGWIADAWRVVRLDRDGVGTEGVRKCLELLDAGAPLLLFPEGSRSRTGDVQPFLPGVGLLALRSGAPVIPISVHGTAKIWGVGESRPRLFGGPVIVAVGKPTVYERPAKAQDVAADIRDRVLDLREAK